MIMFIIFVILAVSTLSSILFWKKSCNKWKSLSVAFCINSILLSITTIILYKLDKHTFHKESDGLFASLGIIGYIIIIPIITLINFYILDYITNRNLKSQA